MSDIEAELQRELAKIEADSIGWTALEDGVYLHVTDANVTGVSVVGLARSDMQAANLLWVY